MRLLLAEDDPDIQFIAGLALRRGGFEVEVVASGSEALDRASAAPPDVILLDWMMPELDGLEVCRRLKADVRTASLPVIFLTAKSQEAEIARGLRLGAAGYITKPFDAMTLASSVRGILAGKPGEA